MNDGVGDRALSNEQGNGVAVVGDQLRCKIMNNGGSNIVGNGGSNIVGDGGSNIVGDGGSNIVGDGGSNGGVEEGKESSRRAD